MFFQFYSYVKYSITLGIKKASNNTAGFERRYIPYVTTFPVATSIQSKRYFLSIHFSEIIRAMTGGVRFDHMVCHALCCFWVTTEILLGSSPPPQLLGLRWCLDSPLRMRIRRYAFVPYLFWVLLIRVLVAVDHEVFGMEDTVNHDLSRAESDFHLTFIFPRLEALFRAEYQAVMNVGVTHANRQLATPTEAPDIVDFHRFSMYYVPPTVNSIGFPRCNNRFIKKEFGFSPRKPYTIKHV